VNEIITRLKPLILEHLKLVETTDQIGDTDDLTTLGMDSMAATNMMIDIEDEFDIHFLDEMLTPETFKSAESLSLAIDSLLAQSVA
jgi:acyl carrier protein